MPTSTPAIKVAAVRALGGIVDLHGESYQEAQAHAQVRGVVVLGLHAFTCATHIP